MTYSTIRFPPNLAASASGVRPFASLSSYVSFSPPRPKPRDLLIRPRASRRGGVQKRAHPRVVFRLHVRAHLWFFQQLLHDVGLRAVPYERMSGWSRKASVGVERRRGRGLKARGERRDAPGKVLKDRRSPRRQGRMGTSDRTRLRFTRGVHQRGHPSRARTLDRIRASVQQRLDALHVPGAARERHRGASRDVAAVVEERHLLLPGVHPSLLRGFFFSLRGVLYERTSGWS